MDVKSLADEFECFFLRNRMNEIRIMIPQIFVLIQHNLSVISEFNNYIVIRAAEDLAQEKGRI